MTTENRSFKWICLAGAAVVCGLMLWMVNDVRNHVRNSVSTINRDLPMILDKTRDSAETMSALSQDVKQLRELVTGGVGKRDENIIAYEIEVLKLIEESNGSIGVKKLVGSGLSDPVPAKEWVARERKAALWDQARSTSKADLLHRIGHSALLKRAWYIDTGDQHPVQLVDWIKANHVPSRELDKPAE